jgi:ATP-dependent exoDNAse (exonuclease V) beta subunit
MTAGAAVTVDAFGPPDDEQAIRRIPVVDLVAAASMETEERRPAAAPDEVARIAGTIAHRIFQFGGTGDRDVAAVRRRLGIDGDVSDEVMARGMALAGALAADPDVAARLAAGRALYEVPFSLRADDRTIVRGSIDCVIESASGDRVTVVELKTGARRAAHDAQLAIYVEAARALFPEAAVEGLLVYADIAHEGTT